MHPCGMNKDGGNCLHGLPGDEVFKKGGVIATGRVVAKKPGRLPDRFFLRHGPGITAFAQTSAPFSCGYTHSCRFPVWEIFCRRHYPPYNLSRAVVHSTCLCRDTKKYKERHISYPEGENV